MSYHVVRIDNGRDNPPTGLVSSHRTLEAAQSAIDKANRRRGYPSHWHPYAIQREYYRVSEYCTDHLCTCAEKFPVLIAECASLSEARSYRPSPGYEILIEKREESVLPDGPWTTLRDSSTGSGTELTR